MYSLKPWKKQSFCTHFAGGYLLKNSKSQKTIDRMTKDIIDCVKYEVDCPIYSKDIFSDGVYYNRYEKKTYVKLLGHWYFYGDGEMFEYYSISQIVNEMDTKDHDAILSIAKTKYASKQQIELAEHIKNFYYFKKMRQDAKRRIKEVRKRLAEVKAQKDKLK